MTKIFKRYAKDQVSGRLFKEEVVFNKTTENHPSAIELEGEQGKWLLDSIADQITDYNIPNKFLNNELVDPLSAPLTPNITIISEQDYLSEVETIKTQKASKIQAAKDISEAKKIARENVLRRLGVTTEELELFK